MMIKKYLYAAIAINLLLGNLLLFRTHGKYETVMGKITIHALATIVALVMLFLLFNKFRNTTKWKVITLSLLGAFSVPFFSTYFLAVGVGLGDGEFNVFLASIPFAMIAGLVTSVYWVPLGLINSFFVLAQAKQHKESR